MTSSTTANLISTRRPRLEVLHRDLEAKVLMEHGEDQRRGEVVLQVAVLHVPLVGLEPHPQARPVPPPGQPAAAAGAASEPLHLHPQLVGNTTECYWYLEPEQLYCLNLHCDLKYFSQRAGLYRTPLLARGTNSKLLNVGLFCSNILACNTTRLPH